MHHQLPRFVLGALFALVALLFAPSIHANSLVNDPFIQQQINKRSFEPGGANHLFGSRGAVSDRKGDIHIIATASIQAGGVNIDQAVIAGYYQYNVKFGGHEHDEHSPFTNSNSQDKTNQQAVTGIDFTSLSLKWTGTEVHPADAYDGEQGSGYPTPTGARDEYSYVVSGNAIGARINLDDNRSTQDRLKDRKNAWNDAQNTITNAFELGLTHDPNLNKAGNATESLSALAMGVGAATGIPFEWLGASDAADGIALAKDLVTLEAIRALPHNQKLQVVHGIKAVQGIQNQYGQWRAANPNVAAALSAVADVAGASFKKGGNSQSVAGDRITGPRGEELNYRGGPHSFTSQPVNDGLDSHHCPAKACYSNSSMTQDKGPAIQMDPIDHKQTASYANSSDAQRYREKQKELLNQGRLNEAIQMDVDDIRSKFGNKYDKAIKEMIDYSKTLNPNNFKEKKD